MKEGHTGKAPAIQRGQAKGAASTTSKAMSCPAKSGWPASQYWAALTMRRRGGQRPGGLLLGLAPLDLDENEPPALERHEVDLADRIALRHDAVAFEAKQECR